MLLFWELRIGSMRDYYGSKVRGSMNNYYSKKDGKVYSQNSDHFSFLIIQERS
jgi:hypothetical protein